MKWFKHLSGSLNNSFIFELISHFGGDGYLVFFGTLELMSDEFDPYKPGENRILIKKLTKNLQLSRQKTVRILRFIDQKAKINPKKNVGFYVEIHKDHVHVLCNRLAELCDDYTRKQLKEISEVSPDKLRSLSVIEEEAEVEEYNNDLSTIVDKSADADIIPFNIPEKPTQDSKHFSVKVGEYFKVIKSSCDAIQKLPQKNGNKFNPYQWVQKHTNEGRHPGAIADTIKALSDPAIFSGIREGPFKYANSILATKNQNWNEKEAIEIHEEFKRMTIPELKKLTAGIMKGIN